MTLKALNQYGKGFQLKVLGSLLTDKTFLQNVAQHWALDGVVMASDGALKKSLRILRGGCCDPALAAHRAPCESGRSRIHQA